MAGDQNLGRTFDEPMGRTMTPRQSASLMPRLVAFGWDYLVILAYLIPLVVAGSLIERFAPEVAGILFSDPVRAQPVGLVLITLPVTLYFSLSEASTRRATWGKRRVGLVVINANGSRVSIPRSLIRTAAKFIPWELAHFFIWQITFASNPESPVYAAGFIAVWVLLGANLGAMFLGDRRQTGHDRIARVLVVQAPSAT